ncbi:translation initiation factor eIF-2B subunit epsilon [Paragonimus westermani]|uniref:Translation initiation factor eIF2B subunit epsilon n=1 Tax=Paragonimus westermani TaxID=34504 RepID=A0A5J4NUS2_9TREM|nr:translation initiation factor eIF-2B subunit epsilon [Paragonimus westermani]
MSTSQGKQNTPSKKTKSSAGLKSSTGASLFKEETKGPYAVIVADLFSSNFEPLVNHTPQCLLPLGTVPLLHFPLTRLIEDGFKSVVIYACAHSKQVRDFISSVQCYQQACIFVHSGENSHSLGDVMRDLETLEVMRGVTDFLLLPADLICSAPLLPLLRQHEQRRARNPSAILSLICPSSSPLLTRSQAAEWGVTVLFSRTADNRLIKLYSMVDDPAPIIYVADLMHADQCSELASDLLDLGLAVCTHHIPPLFQDNFDYQNMNDLIHDVLTNEEIMGYSIHVDSIPQSTLVLRAAPDLHTLINLTPRLLSREAVGVSNLLPPTLLAGDSHQYHCIGPQCYVAKSSRVHPKARLIGACLIGPNCRVEANACLIDCVLTADCTVEEKARLRRVVAGEGVFLGARVWADTAWICARARILSDARLPPACFIGPSETIVVTIGPGRGALPDKSVLVAPVGTDLVLDPQVGGAQVWAAMYARRSRSGRTVSGCATSSSQSVDSEADWDENLSTGSFGGACTLWDTAEDRLRFAIKKNRRAMNRNRAVSSTSEALRLSKSISKRSRDQSAAVTESDRELSESTGDEGEQSETFLIGELRRTLEHSQKNAESTENIVLEVNSLKHAYNIPIEDLHFLLMKALLDLTRSQAVTLTSGDSDEKSCVRTFMVEFNKQLSRFHSVLSSYLSASNADGRLCLQALEDTACYQPLVMSAAPYITHVLYDKDLVTEPAIWWWLDKSPMLADEDLSDQTKMLREKLKPFLIWLKEAEEEEDDDDDSE